MHPTTLKYQFDISGWVANKNLEAVSHDDSLKAPAPAGNNINWILGHVVKARDEMLTLVGKEPMFASEKFERYARGKPPLTDASEAVSFDELMDCYNKQQPVISAALESIPAEKLAEKAPFSPTNNPDETVGTLLAGLMFHEAYHLGQFGVLRRVAGHKGAI